MSYLYDEEERRGHDIETVPLSFCKGDEIHHLCQEVSTETWILLRPEAVVDRSLFVGRHVDTREYGCPLPRLRGLVNRLYEHNLRTHLDCLHVGPLPSFDPVLDDFFASLADCWNKVVAFTSRRLSGERVDLVAMDGWRNFPAPLQLAIMTMYRIVDSVSWIDVGDTRANILEPHLAYVLQRQEHPLQRGMGSGHSLVAVLRIGAEQGA